MVKVVIHGASGWMGRSAIAAMKKYYPDEELKFLLIGSSYRKLEMQDLGLFEIYDSRLIDNELQEFLRPDYYFQLGFKTRDYDRKLGNMEYVKQNQAILSNSENIISRIQPKSIGIISSGVVSQYFEKKDASMIDNYTALKIQEENQLKELSARINANLAVIRLWGSSGKFMTEPLKYGIGDLIYQAIAKAEIKINSNFKVYRRYVDSVEVMMLLKRLMENHHQITIDSGGFLVEIEDLAKEILNYLNLDKPINRDRIVTDYVDDYYSRKYEFEKYAESFNVTLSNLTSQISKTLKAVERYTTITKQQLPST